MTSACPNSDQPAENTSTADILHQHQQQHIHPPPPQARLTGVLAGRPRIFTKSMDEDLARLTETARDRSSYGGDRREHRSAEQASSSRVSVAPFTRSCSHPPARREDDGASPPATWTAGRDFDVVLPKSLTSLGDHYTSPATSGVPFWPG